MTALAMRQDQQQPDKNITSISANARIDYILKFSRHVVVVIDNLNQGFGAISNSYLATLSDTTNASLVTVSNKLNDVQIRARINDQLFSGQPFDPEIALTQSISEHYHTSKAPVAIVIEQAQHLSLQIIHELTLLAEIAKKSGKNIQIVLLGDINTGRIIANNHTLFNKKLSMISAQNGQLITVNSAMLKPSNSLFSLTSFSKIALGLILVLVLTFASLFFMYQQDSLYFSQLPKSKAKLILPVHTKPMTINQPQLVEKASPHDVLSALNGTLVDSIDSTIKHAEPVDILAAITFSDLEVKDATATSTKQIVKISSNDQLTNKATISSSENTAKNNIPKNSVKKHFNFSNGMTGVVIQFSALEINEGTTVNDIVNRFVSRYSLEEYKFYLRLIQGKSFVVITSSVFQTRKDAADAMLTLPFDLQNSGIWLKSVATIQKEVTVDPLPQ